MNKINHTPKVIISKKLENVLDQLGSVSIFDKEFLKPRVPDEEKNENLKP